MEVVERELLDLEARRCAAISSGDTGTLRSLLSDDYVHVHMTGKIDDREGHLQAVSSRPRTTERGKLLVRVYGELAVLTGELTNIMSTASGERSETRAYCQQVAARLEGDWKFVAIQLTPLVARRDQ